jgi:hypothetical protein
MALHPPIKTSILEASKVSGFCCCDGPIKITHCTHPQTKKKKKMDYLTPPQLMSSNMNIILPWMNNNWPLFHINGRRKNLQCANKQTSVHMHERVTLYFFAHI